MSDTTEGLVRPTGVASEQFVTALAAAPSSAICYAELCTPRGRWWPRADGARVAAEVRRQLAA